MGAHVKGKFVDVSTQMYVFVFFFSCCFLFGQNHKIVRITYVLCDCIPCIMAHDW